MGLTSLAIRTASRSSLLLLCLLGCGTVRGPASPHVISDAETTVVTVWPGLAAILKYHARHELAAPRLAALAEIATGALTGFYL
jgi:hypothetical protein